MSSYLRSHLILVSCFLLIAITILHVSSNQIISQMYLYILYLVDSKCFGALVLVFVLTFAWSSHNIVNPPGFHLCFSIFITSFDLPPPQFSKDKINLSLSQSSSQSVHLSGKAFVHCTKKSIYVHLCNTKVLITPSTFFTQTIHNWAYSVFVEI